eukprot:8682986-Alexandrium_andersonii.AAC.1
MCIRDRPESLLHVTRCTLAAARIQQPKACFAPPSPSTAGDAHNPTHPIHMPRPRQGGGSIGQPTGTQP